MFLLALCRHGLPSGLFFGFHSDSEPPGSGLRACEATGREPLDYWRGHARTFRDLLKQIERSRSEPATAADTAHTVNRLAANFGHVRPVLERTSTGTFSIRLAGSFLGAGLAPALSYQLMVWMAEGKGLLICAEPKCGTWFESTGWALRDTYCPQCGRAAALRAARRRSYRKSKREREQARALRAASKGTPDIGL
jgi:hypothetical protein